VLRALQRAFASRRAEVLVRHEGQPLFERELLRAFPDEQHVARLLHDAPGELDGILHVREARDRTCGERPALHDRGIELGATSTGEHGTTASVEVRIVFEHLDRAGDRIEARAAA
jgi:hypothetical protein